MRRLLNASVGLAVVGLSLLAFTNPVAAEPAASQLASNQGQVIAQDGLTVRALSGGQTPSTSLPSKGYLVYQQIVTIRCYYTGQTITGPYGPTNIWDSIIGYQDSTDGVASDAWIFTGSNTPTVPRCGGV